ncbi:NAD-dependent deacetylase [Mycobacteroides chelonae]|nr:NAD-dependent deacetylase [Mycobacteroides chelonae]
MKQTEVPEELVAAASTARTVTVLTGAGMSAESGLPTFRDAQTGLWSKYDPMTLATPESWQEDSGLVWAWYQNRRVQLLAVQPNDGHRALAQWGSHRDVRIVTQNVDDLHERAGSVNVTHVHGSLLASHCDVCGTSCDVAVVAPTSERVLPPECDCGGRVRPGVVWFGEVLPQVEFGHAVAHSQSCDLMLLIGTSGIVYPAAGLPQLALSRGATVVEINPCETDLSDRADLVWRATAATALPALIDALSLWGAK